MARPGTRLPPLAVMGSEGILGRQGRHSARNQALRAVQAADLGDVSGRLCRNGADPILRWRAFVMGVGLSAPGQRLAELEGRDRAPDEASVAGNAPQVDPR